MQDVTSLMNSYRECSRNIWNTHFSGQEDWCRAETIYEQIRKLLFESLVLARLDGIRSPDWEPSATLKVVPIGSMPIWIRRSTNERNVYWDQEPELRVVETEIKL